MNIKVIYCFSGSYQLSILMSVSPTLTIQAFKINRIIAQPFIYSFIKRAHFIHMQGKIPFDTSAHKQKLLQKIQNSITDTQVKTFLETGIIEVCNQLTSVQKQVKQKDQKIRKFSGLSKEQKDINYQFNFMLEERRFDTQDFNKKVSEEKMKRYNSLEDQIKNSRKGVQVFTKTYQVLHEQGCLTFTNLLKNLGQFQQQLSNLKKIKPNIQIMFKEEAPQTEDIFTQNQKIQKEKQHHPQSLLQDRLSDIFINILKETEYLVHNKKKSSSSTFDLLKRVSNRSHSQQDVRRIQRSHSLDLRRLKSQAHNLRYMHDKSQK